jgi:hypothetical protein
VNPLWRALPVPEHSSRCRVRKSTRVTREQAIKKMP